MANVYVAKAKAISDPDFKLAVAYATRRAAYDILNADPPATGARLAMAQLLATDQYVTSGYLGNAINDDFAFAILDNVTIAGTLVDGNGFYSLENTEGSHFEFQVASSWDEIAARRFPESDPEPEEPEELAFRSPHKRL